MAAGGFDRPPRHTNTHQDAESCGTHRWAQVHRAAGDVPQNYRRESSTGPIAERDGTTIIQATGCNFRVSTETTKFDVIFIYFFYIQWVISIMGLLSVTGSGGDADGPFDRYENCIQSLSFKKKKQQKKRHASVRIRWSKKMSAQIWQTVQNWSDLGRKKRPDSIQCLLKGSRERWGRTTSDENERW